MTKTCIRNRNELNRFLAALGMTVCAGDSGQRAGLRIQNMEVRIYLGYGDE